MRESVHEVWKGGCLAIVASPRVHGRRRVITSRSPSLEPLLRLRRVLDDDDRLRVGRCDQRVGLCVHVDGVPRLGTACDSVDLERCVWLGRVLDCIAWPPAMVKVPRQHCRVVAAREEEPGSGSVQLERTDCGQRIIRTHCEAYWTHARLCERVNRSTHLHAGASSRSGTVRPGAAGPTSTRGHRLSP